jgi:hypothetical protein
MVDAVALSMWTRDVQDPEMTPTGSTEHCWHCNIVVAVDTDISVVSLKEQPFPASPVLQS